MLDSLFFLIDGRNGNRISFMCPISRTRDHLFFFPLPLFLRPQAEPTYVSRVFQFVRLKSKESIKRKTKQRSEKNKNKESGSTDECNPKKRKKKKFQETFEISEAEAK